MRGKKHFIVLVTSLIFALGLLAAIRQTIAVPPPKVKVYVDQPLGYIPFLPPGTGTGSRMRIDIIIETNGVPDNDVGGIVGWGMDIQINPASLNIMPVEAGGRSRPLGARVGYFLYEFCDWEYYDYPTLFKGDMNYTTGYWDELAEAIIPTPPGGAGDPYSGYKLVTLEIYSNSDTIPCVIDLLDVQYRTQDGAWHDVDVVEDGYYGSTPWNPPPNYMSYQGSLLPPGDPTGTDWHEIYPNYCKMYHLAGWTDNGDGDLTASDQIDMVNETGWTYHFHVDVVTTTIHWTIKTGPNWPGDSTGELAAAEPVENNLLDYPIGDPIGTAWHQIYPPEDYCKEFVITSWEDNGDGVFSESDQFDFEYYGEGTINWAHLDDITTDIILSQKGEPEGPVPEFPLGMGLIMALAPIIALIYLWRRKEWMK